jgi:flagellar motor switch protein FliG
MNALGQAPLTGSRKAAILVSLLGDEPAATILRNLPERDLQLIADEVANLGQVPFDVTLNVLEEYQQMMSAQDFIAVGGQEVATRLLVKAFGENGAKAMMQRLTRTEDPDELNALKRADPQQLAKFLVGERTQTKALVLGHLDAKRASALLMSMEPEVRADCIRSLANLGRFSPEVVTKVSAVLNRRLRSAGGSSKQAESGFRNVAELMNRLDSTTAREILETIEKEEPTMAIGIRDLMFRFDDFLGGPRAAAARADERNRQEDPDGCPQISERGAFQPLLSHHVVARNRDDEGGLGDDGAGPQQGSDQGAGGDRGHRAQA